MDRMDRISVRNINAFFLLSLIKIVLYASEIRRHEIFGVKRLVAKRHSYCKHYGPEKYTNYNCRHFT